MYDSRRVLCRGPEIVEQLFKHHFRIEKSFSRYANSALEALASLYLPQDQLCLAGCHCSHSRESAPQSNKITSAVFAFLLARQLHLGTLGALNGLLLDKLTEHMMDLIQLFLSGLLWLSSGTKGHITFLRCLSCGGVCFRTTEHLQKIKFIERIQLKDTIFGNPLWDWHLTRINLSLQMAE